MNYAFKAPKIAAADDAFSYMPWTGLKANPLGTPWHVEENRDRAQYQIKIVNASGMPIAWTEADVRPRTREEVSLRLCNHFAVAAMNATHGIRPGETCGWDDECSRHISAFGNAARELKKWRSRFEFKDWYVGLDKIFDDKMVALDRDALMDAENGPGLGAGAHFFMEGTHRGSIMADGYPFPVINIHDFSATYLMRKPGAPLSERQRLKDDADARAWRDDPDFAVADANENLELINDDGRNDYQRTGVGRRARNAAWQWVVAGTMTEFFRSLVDHGMHPAHFPRLVKALREGRHGMRELGRSLSGEFAADGMELCRAAAALDAAYACIDSPDERNALLLSLPSKERQKIYRARQQGKDTEAMLARLSGHAPTPAQLDLLAL